MEESLFFGLADTEDLPQQQSDSGCEFVLDGLYNVCFPTIGASGSTTGVYQRNDESYPLCVCGTHSEGLCAITSILEIKICIRSIHVCAVNHDWRVEKLIENESETAKSQSRLLTPLYSLVSFVIFWRELSQNTAQQKAIVCCLVGCSPRESTLFDRKLGDRHATYARITTCTSVTDTLREG